MKPITKVLIVLLVLLGISIAMVVYRYAQTSPLALVAEASLEPTPAPMKWLAVQSLHYFHPSAEEIADLNQQAGARYLAALPDQAEARRLLQEYQQQGLDLDAKDQQTGTGLTALQGAAIGNETAMVSLLLSLGANPLAEDAQGRTALALVEQSQRNRPDMDFSAVLALLKK
ncbi:ankyrin repeat domain-containing protein [Pokkaliibacter plantistimulans]|nr:ankyrin repeat domain-containing protein [Pokkaliibacter plantistimulans]